MDASDANVSAMIIITLFIVLRNKKMLYFHIPSIMVLEFMCNVKSPYDSLFI